MKPLLPTSSTAVRWLPPEIKCPHCEPPSSDRTAIGHAAYEWTANAFTCDYCGGKVLRPVVDLFAGPGGWSEGLKALGHSELGIEWDEAACLTARAAGHKRLQADVAELNPLHFPCDGLIASPPCQAWSMAGKGGGRRDVGTVITCALEMAQGKDTRAEHAENCEDPRSILVVEPLRWATALQPTWIALEQVPPVLELWTLYAALLTQQGYKTWAGVLEAERYGVPQTRERAVLMAHRDRVVQPPRPTHQRYVPGEPPQHTLTFDGEVLPWVSMAQALGWEEGPSPSPSPSVTGGGGATGGVEVFASKAARSRAADAVALRKPYGDGMIERHGDREPTPATEPAPTMISKVRSYEWVMGINNDRPERKAAGAGNKPRPAHNPAATVDSTSRQALWFHDRPATTVAADPRIAEAGHHERQMNNAVRVTQQEALVLQSFRPDYPVQGSRSKQFEQIGNAVPPLLAQAVLSQLVDPTLMEAAA